LSRSDSASVTSSAVLLALIDQPSMRREKVPCPSDVLDKVTSAIDVEGESVVLEWLQQSTPHPTFVMIAHRLGTSRHCERVLRLKEAKWFRSTATGMFLQNNCKHCRAEA
jgi:ABC-type transport system involved in cytochrome bd biosynthesis fused ATPase/permease subunit